MNDDILRDVRVLDFTSIVSGPYCTRMLADLGAEVIKIEPPEGDFIRTQPPIRAGRSAYFAHLNCGKKSVAIDLRCTGAVALVQELAAKSDVLVENSRPGVMQRLGLDYATLAKHNSRLVLNVAFNYGGRDELVQAIQQMIRDGVPAEDISPELVNRYLYTAGVHDPDLIIRTSGELRISNFLIWQAAYSEWYVTPVFWPDFGREEFRKALDAFIHRDRRYGGVRAPEYEKTHD